MGLYLAEENATDRVRQMSQHKNLDHETSGEGVLGFCMSGLFGRLCLS